MAGIVLAIVGRTDDHLIEVALTTVAAYGSFLLAEQFGGSGILATLTTGMLLGNLAPRWGFISDAGDRVVRSTWEFITFLANSLVFLLIGLAEGHEDFGGLWWTASCRRDGRTRRSHGGRLPGMCPVLSRTQPRRRRATACPRLGRPARCTRPCARPKHSGELPVAPSDRRRDVRGGRVLNHRPRVDLPPPIAPGLPVERTVKASVAVGHVTAPAPFLAIRPRQE